MIIRSIILVDDYNSSRSGEGEEEMEEPVSVPKRHMPVSALIFMLCLGSVALVFSKVKGKIKATRAKAKNP
jgi:hypothetical protein